MPTTWYGSSINLVTSTHLFKYEYDIHRIDCTARKNNTRYDDFDKNLHSFVVVVVSINSWLIYISTVHPIYVEYICHL